MTRKPELRTPVSPTGLCPYLDFGVGLGRTSDTPPPQPRRQPDFRDRCSGPHLGPQHPRPNRDRTWTSDLGYPRSNHDPRCPNPDLGHRPTSNTSVPGRTSTIGTSERTSPTEDHSWTMVLPSTPTQTPTTGPQTTTPPDRTTTLTRYRTQKPRSDCNPTRTSDSNPLVGSRSPESPTGP